MTTIQPSTEAQYLQRATRLLDAYERETGQTWRSAPLAAVEWFARQSALKQWSKQTLLLYRSSFAWYMERFGPSRAADMIRAVAYTPDATQTRARTSARKMKKMPEAMMVKLYTVLETSKNPLDQAVFHWLKAGRATGLRPCEWKHAFLEEHVVEGSRNLVLLVKNAKKGELRANGESRRLIFRKFPEHYAEETAIRDFMRDINKFVTARLPFEQLYAMCRKRLMYVCRNVFRHEERYISLYTPRHQFAADMKASGLTKPQVAALMGHASEESAGEHYARRKDGVRRIAPPEPDASEVAGVRIGKKSEKKSPWKMA